MAEDPARSPDGPRDQVTLGTLRALKANGTPATFITAYDYPSACFADAAGIDMILVGDSGGMTMLGYPTTLPVTMEEMLVFAKAVCRGARRPFVIGDMPFLSYQLSNQEAMRNAGRFIAEAGCDAVKIEGGRRMAKRIRAIVDAGVAVMGHLGLTPQSISLAGGYKVAGKTRREFEAIRDDARALEEAGASFILLEAMPEEPAALIRDAVGIPVYGIGAGKQLDGQLLIFHDLIGAFVGEVKPRFVRQYADVRGVITQALATYAAEVRRGAFPAPEHTYPIDPEELAQIRASSRG